MAHKCFGRPEQKWGDKSLWNRQDVAIQAYLFIPLCRTHCSANYGAWRVSSWTLARLAQQLLLLTGDGGGGHLDHSRVLSYDFHVICETKPQKLNFWVYHLHSWWPLFLRFHPLTTNIWFLSGNNEVLVKQIACENSKKLGLTYSKNHTFDDFHIKIWF